MVITRSPDLSYAALGLGPRRQQSVGVIAEAHERHAAQLDQFRRPPPLQPEQCLGGGTRSIPTRGRGPWSSAPARRGWPHASVDKSTKLSVTGGAQAGRPRFRDATAATDQSSTVHECLCSSEQCFLSHWPAACQIHAKPSRDDVCKALHVAARKATSADTWLNPLRQS